MLLRIAADILDGAEGAAGRLETATVGGKDRTERRIVIHFLRGLLNARMERPILHLDATMPIAAVRQYLPALDVVAEIDAAAPHMRVVQVLSTKDNYGGWGKTSIIPDRAKAQGEGRRRESRLVNLGDFLTLMQRQLGEGSVFTYKDIEERFAKPGIATSHFNAVAGLNSHENATFAAVLGRPSPKPEDAARMVKQLFGRWAEAENMVEVQAALLMADGSARTITTRRFASPDLELIRRSIADDNVVQAVGRVRGVRRTGANPVAVFLFTDVVTPFPVSALTDWPTLELDRVDQMAARGVILKSPADAAKAYPDLFKDARAAYDALRAGRSNVKTPKKSIFIGEFTFDRPFATVRYRPLPTQAEPKPKTRTADVTDMTRVPGIRAWLEALVGPLALFEIVPADQAAQGPPGDEGDTPEVAEAPAPEDIAAGGEARGRRSCRRRVSIGCFAAADDRRAPHDRRVGRPCRRRSHCRRDVCPRLGRACATTRYPPASTPRRQDGSGRDSALAGAGLGARRAGRGRCPRRATRRLRRRATDARSSVTKNPNNRSRLMPIAAKTADHETPIQVPIRTDETGVIYVPLYPVPGMRSVPLSVNDLLILWHANVRNGQQAAAKGDVTGWTAATMNAEFYLSVAIELEPQLAPLRAFPLPIEGQGEA